MRKLKFLGNTTKPGNPLWDEYAEVDDAGNIISARTLEVYDPKRITNYDKCEHKFIYTDNGNSAVCSLCGMGLRIILGIHKIEDGKLVTNKL
jgi:hypothetical protein